MVKYQESIYEIYYVFSYNVYANWNCLVNGNIIFLLLPVPLAIFQTYDFLEWCKFRLTDDFNDFINKSIFSR